MDMLQCFVMLGVGGSIWGITFGGIIVMIIGTVLFRNMSKRCKENLK